MDRKEFLRRGITTVGCCAMFGLLDPRGDRAAGLQAGDKAPDPEKAFIQNWLSDLMDSIDKELPEDVKSRLIGACGRACFERHDFKRKWAIDGKGDVDKLIAALQKNFLVRREGALVHILYGEVSQRCYCPAANYRPSKANDAHCYCTRATHQAVWETALGRPIRVDIAETLRRGGKTCHFVVHLA